ncbi:hypothetical protein [Methanococcus maripaludis]|uniref:Glycosyltransferase RgtA/B/C/D-like domain-containing protein n=1 Tax=Methanococcus maripaludis TaxID=39152 RepID=A0A7J9PB73_METMI|nr:hypothetical protein [Methanococcus maripaludis]MBA2860463.1 hypothetical protein [Methanococcus maripaludis]
MTHIGYITDIISFGNIGILDYPIIHILLSIISLTCNLDVITLSMYASPFYSIFYVFLIYLLSKFLLGNQHSLISLITCVLLLNTQNNFYLVPWGFAVFSLPLFFYIFLKYNYSKRPVWAILLIIFSIMYPFFHMQSSLYVILTLCLIYLLNMFADTMQTKSFKKAFLKNTGIFINISIILLVFSSWTTKFKRFFPNITSVFNLLNGKGSSNKSLDDKLGKFSKIGMEGFSIIIYVIKAMGSNIIMFMMSGISLILFIKNYKGYSKIEKNIIVIFCLTFLAYFLYIAVNLNLIQGLKAIGADRFITYASIFTPILSSIFLVSILKINKPFKNTGISIISLILIVSSTLSSLYMYPSTYSVMPSSQNTFMNFYGYSWLFNNNHEHPEILSILSSPFRYKDAIMGVSATKNIPRYRTLPDHFDYYENISLGSSIHTDSYVFISEIDKITYSGVWKNVGRFNNNDFEKTCPDTTINNIYSNKEANVWLVNKE